MERGRQFRTTFRGYAKVTAIASNLDEGYKPISAVTRSLTVINFNISHSILHVCSHNTIHPAFLNNTAMLVKFKKCTFSSLEL